MKKVLSILMVAVALMMAAPAQAQLIKFGVKGGMNFSELDFSVKNYGEVKDNSTGFFIGPMAEITLPIIGLGVDGALMYSQRNTGVGEGNMKQQGLEVPINLKYTFGLGSMLGIYLSAGPDFFFNFKDIESIAGLETEKSQISVNLGAGVKLLRKLQIGLTYQIPLSDSFMRDINGGANFTAKTKTWQVSLAYIF